jgi:hypothetical protein
MAEKEATLVVRLKDLASQELKSLQGAISSLRSNFLLIAGVITGTIAVIWSMVKAYAENEQAVNRLNVALKNQGVTNQEVSQDLQKYAAELAKVSTFTDEALMASEALFATMGFGSEKIKKATQMAADLAATMGWDLHQATLMVGKALSGNVSILQRYGLTLGDVERMHGAASSQLNTVSGKVQNLENRWGELKETIGKWLIPAVDSLLIVLQKAATAMEHLTGTENANLSKRELSILALQKESDQLATILGMYDKYGKSNTEVAKSYQARFDAVQKQIVAEKQLLATASTSFGGRPTAGESDDAQKERERVAKETAAMLQGLTSKGEARAALSAYYDDMETARLQMFLTNKEAVELASLLKSNQQIGDAAKFKELKAKSLADAEVKYETEKAKKIQKLDEERKKNFSDTLQFISTLSESKNKELATIGKAASIALAYIYTYEAANKALASAPPPWNFALAAMVVAAGLANVAKIVGVGMAQGGVVMPTPGGTLATIGEGGRAEAVIPLGDRRAMEAMGGLGGGSVGNVYVTVNGVNDPRAIAERVGHEIIRAIRGQGQIDFTR